MAYILAVDETSGTQTQSGQTTVNDLSLTGLTLPQRLGDALTIAADTNDTLIAAARSPVTATNTSGNVINFSGLVNGFSLGGANGAVLPVDDPATDNLSKDGLLSDLKTATGADIELYLSSVDDNVVLGRNAVTNELVFAIYLEPTVTTSSGTSVSTTDASANGARLWLVQYDPIYHNDPQDANDLAVLANKLAVTVDTVQNFSAEGAPSGQNLFLMLGEVTPTAERYGIVVTGYAPADNGASVTSGDTVNTGQGGGGTTIGSNNQMVDPGEKMYFTFVKGTTSGVTIPNLDQNEADVEGNIQFTDFVGSRGATFSVVQLQPPKTATLLLTAINEQGTAATERGTSFIEGLSDGDEASVDITSVTITRVITSGKTSTKYDFVFSGADGKTVTVFKYVNGAPVLDTAATLPAGLQVDLDGNGQAYDGKTAWIQGILAGDRVSYTTAADHQRLLIENYGNTSNDKFNSSFDIGGFSLTSGARTAVPLGDIAFVDDAPTVSANQTVQLDDDALAGGNAGGTGDDPNAVNTSGTLGLSFGADGAGSVQFLETGSPTGFSYVRNTTTGALEIKQGTTTVLTLTVDAATGAYTVTQNAAVQHASGSAENNQAFTVSYQVTDKDGDSATGTLSIDVDDDTPVIIGATDLIYPNANNNNSTGGTGRFAFAIGADQRTTFGAGSSDFASVTLSGTVGGAPIIPVSIALAEPETAGLAKYTVQFNYYTSPLLDPLKDQPDASATGTLTFDKVAGTYSFVLSEPIKSYSVLSTSTAKGFTGYEPGTSTPDSTQPAVSVANLSANNDFFVQFTGIAEPGSGTGTDNLRVSGSGNGSFGLFTQQASWVSVSGTAAGVAGDTIQKGEVLDLDFFKANPTGFTASLPDQTADAIYIKFDGLTNSDTNGEDFVVVLKLVDGANHITRAIVVENQDIYFRNEPASGIYAKIPLDNNDGLVVIERNDYNGTNENWQIEGMQILVSTEGNSGSGIDLNRVTGGTSGASPQALVPFNNLITTDNDVMKITDLGFLTTQTSTTKLTFNVTVQDRDGDQAGPQQLDVTIAGGHTLVATTDAETLQGTVSPAGGPNVVDTFVFASVASSPQGASHDYIRAFEAGIDKIDLSGIDTDPVLAGDQPFAFIGDGAFTGSGQVRYNPLTNLLEANTDGNASTVEFAVELLGLTGETVAQVQASLVL